MVYVPPICSNIVLAIMKTSFDTVIVPKEVSVYECAIFSIAYRQAKHLAFADSQMFLCRDVPALVPTILL